MEQKITEIVVGVFETYKVGRCDVTDIKESSRRGIYNDIPYIEVYKNGKLHSEFCQHNIIGVYYGERDC